MTDQTANIELVYDTSDNNAETDGLAFKLFYNSTAVGQAIDEGFIFGESESTLEHLSRIQVTKTIIRH